MEDYTKKENVYCENGLWYFNAKKVDLGHFEVIYSLEGGFADKESAEAIVAKKFRNGNRTARSMRKI